MAIAWLTRYLRSRMSESFAHVPRNGSWLDLFLVGVLFEDSP